MSEITYIGASSHVGAIIKAPDLLPERSRLLNKAWDQMAAEIHDAALDAVIVIGTDHYETFGLEHYPSFCLGVADNYEAWGEFGNPEGHVVGAPSASHQLLESLVQRGFDISRSHEMPLDHAFMVPIVRLGLTDLPIIPLFINYNTPPLPTLRRCRELGEAIRSAVREMPGNLRVGIIATGGVSHWVGLPQYGNINPEWDKEFLSLLANGGLEEVLDWSDAEILKNAGNGALEIRTWIVAQAASGSLTGSVLSYQPMPPWAIGIGIMRMDVTS